MSHYIFNSAASFGAGSFIQTSVDEIARLKNSQSLSLALDFASEGVYIDVPAGSSYNCAGAIGNDAGGNERTIAQSFYVDGAAIFTKAKLIVTSSTGVVTVYATIVADDGGLPGDNILAESNRVAISSSGTYTFTFETPVFLDADTSYWLVFQSDPFPLPNNLATACAFADNPYPGGHAIMSFDGVWYVLVGGNGDYQIELFSVPFYGSGSWISPLQSPTLEKITQVSLSGSVPGSAPSTANISSVKVYDENDVVIGIYDTPIAPSPNPGFFNVSLEASDFTPDLSDIRIPWKFGLELESGSAPIVTNLMILTTQRTLYNEILRDFKNIIDGEFGPDFLIQIGGTSEPRRDANIPFVYITPMNIDTAFNPIGHQTNSGHGEGQVWPITLSFIVRRGVVINDTSEAELLRDIGERMYKLARNIEEDTDTYFVGTFPFIRYLQVGNVSTTLYSPDTEEFRIDVDVRIEFNITR